MNLYNSYILIGTTVYIVHGPFVSLYSLTEKKWLKNIRFEDGDVLKMIKINKIEDSKQKIELIIILESG